MNQLTLFAEASLVNRSPLPGSKEARKMTAISGRKCLGLSRNSGPIGLLVRMCLESSRWNSTKCFLTWKIKGTKHRRLLFQLAPSMPRTEEIGYGLLPTITQFDATCGDLKGKEFTGKNKHAMKLIQAVRMLPTPTASMMTAQDMELAKSAGNSPDRPKYSETGVSGSLNPQFVSWMMGFPLDWCDIEGE